MRSTRQSACSSASELELEGLIQILDPEFVRSTEKEASVEMACLTCLRHAFSAADGPDAGVSKSQEATKLTTLLFIVTKQ